MEITDLAKALGASREKVLRSAYDFNEHVARDKLSSRTLYNYFSGNKLSLRNKRSREWFSEYLRWASQNFQANAWELGQLAANEGLNFAGSAQDVQHNDPGQRFVATSIAEMSKDNPYLAEIRERVAGFYELFVPNLAHRKDANEKRIRTWALILSSDSDLSIIVDDRGRTFMGSALFLRQNIILNLMPRDASIDGDFLSCAFRANEHYLGGLLAGMITKTVRYSNDIVAFRTVARRLPSVKKINLEREIAHSHDLSQLLDQAGVSLGETPESATSFLEIQNVIYGQKVGLDEDFLYSLESIENYPRHDS